MEAKMLAERLLLGWCVPIGKHVYKAVLVTDDSFTIPCDHCSVQCLSDSEEIDVCVLLDILSGKEYYLERLDGDEATDVME